MIDKRIYTHCFVCLPKKKRTKNTIPLLLKAWGKRNHSLPFFFFYVKIMLLPISIVTMEKKKKSKN